jgi:leader peptidase (prepilin peptidase)/N-methyltransferase
VSVTAASIALAVVAGLVIGSFLTVVVDRVPRGESVVRPGSACAACGLQLGPRDLVPVLSWVALRGRCRRCRARIGVEPLVLELGTAALFVGMVLHFGPTWTAAAYCVLCAGLLALSWIDLRTRRLPREITYTVAAIGGPLLVVAALVENRPARIATMVAGAAIALTFMALVFVASRGGMGDGDVRLSPLLGGYLGWLGLGYVPVGLFIGFLLGAVVGVAAMVAGSAGRKTALPFGPFLAAGTIVGVLAGQAIIDAVWWV